MAVKLYYIHSIHINSTTNITYTLTFHVESRRGHHTSRPGLQKKIYTFYLKGHLEESAGDLTENLLYFTYLLSILSTDSVLIPSLSLRLLSSVNIKYQQPKKLLLLKLTYCSTKRRKGGGVGAELV